MDDTLRQHVEDLLASAEVAAGGGDWASARAFATAALALSSTDERALRLVHTADVELDTAGERRQLTVMFCDVVGSTALSQRTDPEVVREVIRAYRRVVDAAVTRAEGRIALWIGDGVLVYFGHPQPHEDDAFRAVAAGLDLVRELVPVADDARRRHGVQLDVRVAVHTGEVIRAEMGTPSAPDRDAIVGATPNLAARLQDKARPGTVVISEQTNDLVRGRFAVVPIGPFSLKGIAEAITAYEVRGEAVGDPFAQLADRGRLVDREREMALLAERWQTVRDGGAGGVLLRGDAGIGKSRLAAELRRRIVDAGDQVLACGCSAHHASTPLHPVRRLIEAGAGLRPDDDVARQLQLLREALTTFGREDALPLVADLLGIPPGPQLAAPELDPQRLRDELLRLLTDWVAALSSATPLAIVVDDLQWADPTTLDLISRVLARRLPRVLLVLTARTSMTPLWSAATVPVIDLEPLDGPATAELVGEITHGRLDAEAAANVAARSDGVPLYIEELGRAAMAAGRSRASGASVPPALRDPLLSRLAAGGDLALAQLLATVGDEVPHDVLREIAGMSTEALHLRLASLLDAGVVVATSAGAYRFHHQLLADLAYETQLAPARTERHATIADALARRVGVATGDATLAMHLERGGRPAEAIEQYLLTARRAQRLGSFTEAMHDLDHALGLLLAVADADQRDSLELLVREARGLSWTATIGFGAPEAVADYQRCGQLLGVVPPRLEHGRALLGVFTYFLLTGDLATADELNTTARHELEARGVETPMPEAGCAALTRFFRGDFLGAVAAADELLRLPAGQLDAPVPDAYPLPNEPVATTLGVKVAAATLMGDVTAARAAADDARTRAARLPFPYGPYSAAFAGAMAALVWFQTGEEDRSLATIAEIREVVERHGMIEYAFLTNLQQAAAETRFGQEDATPQFGAVVSVWEATGAIAFLPAFHASLARAQIVAGAPVLALETIAAAQSLADRTGCHFWDAPLRQFRGEARVALGEDDGLDDLLLAAAIASSQGARLFELQARLSYFQRSSDPIARKELADVVDTFADEPDIPDLVDARALLRP